MVKAKPLFERTETPDGWEYKDPAESSLVIKSLLFLGFDLPSFDTWLEELAECVAKRDLLILRRGAVKLAHDHLKDRLTILKLCRKTIERDDYVVPLARLGKTHKTKQQSKAQKPRQKKNDSGEQFSIKAIAGKLKHNHPGETANDLWVRLNASLEGLGLAPEEKNDSYRYTDGDGKQCSIKFGTFKNYVSESIKK